MGRITGKTYNAATEVAGVRLGQPTVVKADGTTPPVEGDSLADCWFAWDDSRIPDATIDAAGVLTLAPADDIDGKPAPAPVVEVKVAGERLEAAVKVAPVKSR
jgi:hypothetical protein